MKKCLSVLTAMALISTGAVNFSGFSAAEAAESIPALTVDAGDKRHEILHSATGFLYGISNENSPSSNTLTAIKPKILATKGALGTEHPYGEALDAADEFFESGGEMVMMYNNGYYGKFGVDAETSEYAEVSANTQNPPASLYIGSSKGTSVSLDEILIKSVVPEKEYNPLMSFEVRDGNTYVEMTDIESCAIAGVRYDENGRLIAVKTSAAESSMDKTQNVVLNGIEANKVFAWNSLSDIQPVY